MYLKALWAKQNSAEFRPVTSLYTPTSKNFEMTNLARCGDLQLPRCETIYGATIGPGRTSPSVEMTARQ